MTGIGFNTVGFTPLGVPEKEGTKAVGIITDFNFSPIQAGAITSTTSETNITNFNLTSLTASGANLSMIATADITNFSFLPLIANGINIIATGTGIITSFDFQTLTASASLHLTAEGVITGFVLNPLTAEATTNTTAVSIPSGNANYVIGQASTVLGQEDDSAEILINTLFNVDYLSSITPLMSNGEANTSGFADIIPISITSLTANSRTSNLIEVDPLVSNLTRSVITSDLPDTATIPNNRTVN